MDAFLAATVIVAAATILGQAIWTLTVERRWAWTAPGVGLATLIALCSAAIELPGGATAAAVVCAIAIVAAGAVLVVLRAPAPKRPLRLIVVPLAFAVAAIPFLATGRIGLLGVSLNNDTAQHLIFAEVLRSGTMRALYGSVSYPTGPHSVMATLAQGLGMELDRPMLGLMIAVQVLFAMVAMGALAGIRWWARLPAALVVAFAYMLAAYYGQGAFKETVLALLLVTFAGTLQRLACGAARPAMAGGVPLGLLVAAGVLTYSYVGIAWFVTSLGILAALWLVDALLRHRPLLPAVRSVIGPALVAGVVLLAAIAADLGRIVTFFHDVGTSPLGTGNSSQGIASTALGNLVGPIPAIESLGIWPSADFRFAPAADSFMFGPLKLAMVLALAYGLLVLLRRREAALPATFAGAAIIYFGARGHDSPYVVAKALAVMAPLALLIALRGLLVPRPGPAAAGTARQGATLVIAGVLILGAAQSSLMLLRATPVESTAQRDQLAQLRHLIGNSPTLFLPIDDYAAWRLRGAALGYFSMSGIAPPIPLHGNPAKPWSPGQPADFDSVSPADLDKFRYVITTRAAYQSTAPPNFRRVSQTGLYALWRRVGRTPPGLRTVEEPGTSTGILRCGARAQRGVAVIWPRDAVAVPPPTPLAPNASATVTLRLPRGTWDLSTQYQSSLPARVLVDSEPVADLPANLTRPGPFWPLATVHSVGRPIQLYITARRNTRLTSLADTVAFSTIVATPRPLARIVALSGACGRQADHLLPR